MKNYLILFVFHFLFFSCTIDVKNDVIKHEVKKIEPVKSLEIPLNGEQYNNHAYQLAKADSGGYILFGLDKYRKRIHQYDLEELAYKGYIDFSAEHDNINDIHQFYLASEDSIFLFSPGSNIMYLIDQQGALRSKWQLNFTLPKEVENKFDFAVLNAVSDYNSGFYYDQNHNELNFSLAFYDGSNFLSPDIYQYHPIGKLQLTNDEQELKLSGKFPPSYLKEKVPFDICYNISPFNNEPLLNFQYSPELYYNGEFITLMSAYDTSDPKSYIKLKDDPTTEEQLEGFNTDFAYVKAQFNPANNKIYRLCKHAQSKFDKDNLLNQYLQSSWSLIVYDVKTKKIEKEIVFESGKYDFRWLFSADSGILVLKENPFNEENLEDSFELDFFKI